MNVLFLHDENLEMSLGVRTKIEGQTAIWRSLDIDVTVHGMRDGRPVDQNGPRGSVRKVADHWRAVSGVRHALDTLRPDLVYMRYVKYAPGLPSLLGRHSPVICEINTDDRREYFAAGWHHGMYNLLTRHRLLSRVSAFVTVSRELSERLARSGFTQPRTVIANGIEAGAGLSEVHAIWRRPDERLRAVFVGSAGKTWHGVDKLLWLARQCPGIEFHIIGLAKTDISRDEVIPSNLVCYGQLSPTDIQRVIAQMDVGISSLAIDRAGLSEASPLKSREYLLAGLPILLGYSDTDLIDAPEWVCNVGSGDANVSASLERIRRFFKTVRGHDRNAIARWARENLSLAAKERDRVMFMRAVASGHV